MVSGGHVSNYNCVVSVAGIASVRVSICNHSPDWAAFELHASCCEAFRPVRAHQFAELPGFAGSWLDLYVASSYTIVKQTVVNFSMGNASGVTCSCTVPVQTEAYLDEGQEPDSCNLHPGMHRRLWPDVASSAFLRRCCFVPQYLETSHARPLPSVASLGRHSGSDQSTEGMELCQHRQQMLQFQLLTGRQHSDPGPASKGDAVFALNGSMMFL